jgi:hypothetical protein
VLTHTLNTHTPHTRTRYDRDEQDSIRKALDAEHELEGVVKETTTLERAAGVQGVSDTDIRTRLRELAVLKDGHTRDVRENRDRAKTLGDEIRRLRRQHADDESRAKKKVLEDAEVVCATCSSSYVADLRGLSFDLIVVDEAAQCAEPELIIPAQVSSFAAGLSSSSTDRTPLLVNVFFLFFN